MVRPRIEWQHELRENRRLSVGSRRARRAQKRRRKTTFRRTRNGRYRRTPDELNRVWRDVLSTAREGRKECLTPNRGSSRLRPSVVVIRAKITEPKLSRIATSPGGRPETRRAESRKIRKLTRSGDPRLDGATEHPRQLLDKLIVGRHSSAPFHGRWSEGRCWRAVEVTVS
jgi:hypothetical protein